MVKLPNPKPTHGPECYPVYKDNIDSGRWEVPGITSVVCGLALDPALYSSMGHFFRADSWEWEELFTA